jgi:hypothetical protein
VIRVDSIEATSRPMTISFNAKAQKRGVAKETANHANHANASPSPPRTKRDGVRVGLYPSDYAPYLALESTPLGAKGRKESEMNPHLHQ